jgi:hypothetical protein
MTGATSPPEGKEGDRMGLFFAAFVGGLAGTVLMDIVESLLERFGITSRSA